MKVEFVPTEWFNAEALRLPDYKVGRVNFSGGRAYIRLNNDGQPCEAPLKLYTSLTTSISQSSPMEQLLLEWYVKHGLKEAGRLLEIAQHYGTLMHLEVGKFLINQFYDFSSIEAAVEDYLSEHTFYQPETKEWTSKLQNDLTAFIQFYLDYKIVPLGIEYVLLSERGYGTLIDLVCNMTIQVDGYHPTEVYKSGPRKGQPKECKVDKSIRAIINFKSGRHGFYRTNGLQIEAERMLWEENFPDLPLDAGFNWSPKEWRGETPTYNLKDWTGYITKEEVEAVMMLADIRYASKAEKKTYTTISGVFSIADREEGLSKVISREGITEFVSRKFGYNVGVEDKDPDFLEYVQSFGRGSRPAIPNPYASSPVVNKPISSPLPI